MFKNRDVGLCTRQRSRVTAREDACSITADELATSHEQHQGREQLQNVFYHGGVYRQRFHQLQLLWYLLGSAARREPN